MRTNLTPKTFLLVPLDHYHNPNQITVMFLNFRTQENCCNLPKIQKNSLNLRVFRQKHANGIANSEDPDQTALGLHCLPNRICPKT